MSNKYNVSALISNGHKYDSKAECVRHLMLMQLEKDGKIQALHFHEIVFMLGVSDKGRAIRYTPDFTYIEDGCLIANEVKGFRVRDWPVRAAYFKDKFPEWKLVVTEV